MIVLVIISILFAIAALAIACISKKKVDSLWNEVLALGTDIQTIAKTIQSVKAELAIIKEENEMSTPFSYDAKKKVWRLKGDLSVTGYVSAGDVFVEEKKK